MKLALGGNEAMVWNQINQGFDLRYTAHELLNITIGKTV